MVYRRVPLSILVLGIGVVGAVLCRRLWSPSVSAHYTAGNFTAGSSSTEYAYDGATNVYIGSFTLPNPVADTLILDGASNAVAAKNALTAFASAEKMLDTSNNAAFESTEGIVSSADTALDAGDTVLTPGTSALATIASTNAPGLLLYVDQGATSSSFDTNEDVLRQVFNNAGNVTVDGSTLRTAENTLAFFDVDNDSVMDFDATDNTYSLSGETIIRDADADSKPSAGDSVITAQNSGVRDFVSGDKVCFDGSVVNDAEYDANEIVWLDVAGNCSSFTTGADSILLGGSAPSGTSTLFGTEKEVAYLDTDASGVFTCTRAGTCEPLLYSGADGVNVTYNTYLPATTVFFDSSTEATDGIATTGTGWDESGASERLVDWSALTASGEQRYVYVDQNSDALYTYSEDVFFVASPGSTAAIATGQTLRTFDSNEKLLMVPGVSQVAFGSGNGAIVQSVDSNLTAGALNGSGTDKILLPAASMLSAMPSTTKYYDHDTSGSYANGDDIVSDTDTSGYYNADDILSTQVTAAASSDSITDSYLTGVYIYQRVGNSCVGSGTDTLLGSDVSSPFLAQAISLTKAAYATSDSVASRTLCVYADIADNTVHGKIWALEIPANGAIFASSVASPTSAFSAVSSPVQFVVSVPVTTTASVSFISTQSSYTFAYTLTEDAVLNAKGLFDVTFPSGFTIASSTTTCTANGSSVTVTPTISSQSIRAVNASGSTVTVGTAIVCTVSGVTNPSTVGTTGVFTIGTDNGTTSRRMGIDVNNTVTMSAPDDSVDEPVVNSIALESPNGGESLVAGAHTTISWVTAGTGISFVNLLYSENNGSTWETLATNEANDGLYTWTIPSAETTLGLIMVEGTDLVTVVDDDSSDAVFTISSSSSGSATDTSSEATTETGAEQVAEPVVETVPVSTATLTDGMFIKLADFPTVYAIDEYLVRHPFFDAQTFFTYQENFDGVLTVDADTFAQSTLGTPQPVNAQMILVRFDSSATVYTVNRDADGLVYLRPVPDEASAVAAFGADWSDRVIVLSDSAIPYYVFDSEEETADSLLAWAASSTLTDRWHLMYPDAALDADADGAATWLEASWGTQPYDSDTDNDGYTDWLEVETGHSPLLDGGR